MQDLSFVPAADSFCILLAGGRGSRLHELTQEECKPALAFGDGRLVDFTLANAKRSGLHQMLVATQYRPHGLAAHLNAVWRRRFGQGLRIRDGNRLQPGGYRGTADAVRANLPEIMVSRAGEVLILSADHVYRMDYRALLARHRETGASVTVAVDDVALPQPQEFGVPTVGKDGWISGFHEKPRNSQPSPDDPAKAVVSLGIYVLDTGWLIHALARHGMDDFGHDILPEAVAEGVANTHRAAKVAGPDFYWRDVGTLPSYRRTQLDFVNPDLAPFAPSAQPHRAQKQRLHSAERGTILLPGARLSRRARVSNAILGPGAAVHDGMVIGEDPDHDRRWFRVVNDGTVLVTAAMLARRREEIQRPVPIGWRLAEARAL